jgi:hypothetical protein
MILLALAFFSSVIAAAVTAAGWGARRLGLDLMDILLWLGLAERPVRPIERVGRRLRGSAASAP